MDDLKLIKKYYGENMMHLCRELFPTLLETDGLLFKILSDNFYYSKLLYNDIVEQYMEEEFKDYIYSFINVEKNNEIIVNKTPFELMKDAGYTLYECKSEYDIQRFKKYYARNEQLCTFRGNRLYSCYVFFAVKDNVDEIKREDFDKPSREDLYGTSVISIQFRKGDKNTVSIKNRYNHSVNNPDNTFCNNLDTIIPGLVRSFEREYNLNISKESIFDFELNNYAMDKDGKYFKYNYEINNVYYGPNNLIIDNFEQVSDLDPAKLLVLDYYIFDLENKTIKCFDDTIVDTFPAAFKNIDKMEILKITNTSNKELLIYHDGVISKIVFDDKNRIKELNYQGDMKIIEQFMPENIYLYKIKLEKAEIIGKSFMNLNNLYIKFVDLPNVLSIGYGCLCHVDSIASFKAPKVTDIGDFFFEDGISKSVIVGELDLSSLENIGEFSLLKKPDGIRNLKISDKFKDKLSGGKSL